MSQIERGSVIGFEVLERVGTPPLLNDAKTSESHAAYNIDQSGAEYLDLLRLHLQEISKRPLLSTKEHYKLSARIFSAQLSLRALAEIAASNLPTIYQKQGIESVLSNNSNKFLLNQLKMAENNSNRHSENGNRLRNLTRSEILTNHKKWLLRQIEELGQIKDEKERDSRLEALIDRQIAHAARGVASHQTLVECNMRLVVASAKRFQVKGMSILELVDYGYEGLMKAAARFDFRKGYKFSTYATWWINQTITRAIQAYSSTIRLPVHVHERLRRFKRQATSREQADGKLIYEWLSLLSPVDDGGLFAALNSQRIVSLNRLIDEEVGSEFGDILPDDSVNVEEETYKSQISPFIREVLDSLTKRERQVLIMRFGLNGQRAKSLQDVGQTFNVTRERIRQIESKALRKLRHDPRIAEFREIDPQPVKTNASKELRMGLGKSLGKSNGRKP